MESVLGRYKNLIVLVGVLFFQVLGLAVQVKRTTDTESSRLIRVWAVSTVTPFEKLFVWFHSGTGNLWHNYFYLRGVRAENRELKQQIEQLRLEQVRLSEDAAQARRLQSLLAFKEKFISQTIAAQVIGSGGSEQSRVVYIDKGDHDGIKPDMAVITVDGIVGKILRTTRSSSQVLLIDDQSSGVGAILEKSRLQGILRGTPAGDVVLEKIMNDENVQSGDIVRTSGGDRIYPKGLPVGVVSRVSNGSGSDLFLFIRVKPSANLGKLEEVLVVTRLVETEPALAESGPMRAADILAQRLPSVPDKPADAAPPANAANPASTAPEHKAQEPAASRPGAPKPNDGAPATAAKPRNPAPQIQPAGVVSNSSATSSTALKPATERKPTPPPAKVPDPAQAQQATPSSPTPVPAKPQDGPQ